MDLFHELNFVLDARFDEKSTKILLVRIWVKLKQDVIKDKTLGILATRGYTVVEASDAMMSQSKAPWDLRRLVAEAQSYMNGLGIPRDFPKPPLAIIVTGEKPALCQDDHALWHLSAQYMDTVEV